MTVSKVGSYRLTRRRRCAGDRPRSDARHAAPEMHGAPPAAHTRNTFAFHEATPGRGTPKDAAALPPAARGRPVTDENVPPKPAICFKIDGL